MRPPGPVPLILWVLLSLLISTTRSQSTCSFMKQTPYDLSDIPKEPERALSSHHCKIEGVYSCCTLKLEREMENFARQKVDHFVQSHIVTMRENLEEFAKGFRADFRDAIRSTERQLDRMFEATYGPFYRSNAKLFSDFFDEVDEQFAVEDSMSMKPALASLFRKIFLTEFSLMNPLRDISDGERHCMARLQGTLKPFGQIPQKLSLQLERAFVSWKVTIQTLEKTSQLLINISDKLVLNKECVSGLIRLRQCHVCVGANPQTKPCMGFCLNTLKGCFAEIAEIEPQWTQIMEALQLLAERLKAASNPFAVFAPLPIQLSEAIMLFQEKGDSISNRIVFQCFSPKFRVRRSIELPSERPIVVTADDSPTKWLKDSLDEQYKKGNTVQKQMARFTDRLILMKSAWRLLPSAICGDGQVAASGGDQCWNGREVAPYRRKIVAAGVFPQRRNPEFMDNPMNISTETFIDERLKLATMSNHLLNLLDGKLNKMSEVIEGSALEDLNPNPDDEDAYEGSAYNNGESTDPEEDIKIHLLEQKGLPSSGFRPWPVPFLAIILFILLRI